MRKLFQSLNGATRKTLLALDGAGQTDFLFGIQRNFLALKMNLLLPDSPGKRKNMRANTAAGFVFPKSPPIFAVPNKKPARGISSAGSEHLPYKQRVTGSNPVFLTLIYSYLGVTLSGFLSLSLHNGLHKHIVSVV